MGGFEPPANDDILDDSHQYQHPPSHLCVEPSTSMLDVGAKIRFVSTIDHGKEHDDADQIMQGSRQYFQHLDDKVSCCTVPGSSQTVEVHVMPLKPRQPPRPNPEKDAKRTTSRAVEPSDTDMSLICCNRHHINLRNYKAHLRWHKDIAATGKGHWCEAHQKGFLKKGDYKRHLQSHEQTIRVFVKCPKYGHNGCDTFFGHLQNIKRHLQSKHNVSDEEALRMLIKKAKTDPSLRVSALENPTAKPTSR